MLIPFDNVRLPADIEQGSEVGPSFQTTIVPLSSGAEQRNADWAQEKLTADISYGVMAKRDPKDASNSFAAVMSFYRARMGRHRGFRFRDWSDYQIEAEPLTVIPGTSYGLLTVAYEDNYRRIITRPDLSTLSFSRPGAYTVLPGGFVIFGTPPVQGMTYGCEFDVPMRFDSDIAQVSLLQVEAGSIPSIKLIQTPDPPTPELQELLKNAEF